MNPIARTMLALALVGATACSGPLPEPSIHSFDTPAPPGSVFPGLAVEGDELRLVWTEPGDDTDAPQVRWAGFDGERWSETETIETNSRLFVNWADFPSVVPATDGSMAAHWLVRGGGPAWAYGVRFAVRDAAGHWSAPSIPHGRERAAEHGFVSILAAAPGAFDVIWLDGREMEHGGTMELRHTVWTDGGFGPEEVLDDDACTCCQTDAAAFEALRFVAYRDHAAGEIRDISYVRFDGSEWSRPIPLSRDGWEIGACPVNGPALDAGEAALTVAWFTQARDEPRVWAKRSDDFGETFGESIRIDEGDPIGRVDVASLDDGRAVVVWLERRDDEAAVLVRSLSGEGPGPVHELGRTAAHRQSGFPRLAGAGQSTWVAWTETSRPSRLRLTRLDW